MIESVGGDSYLLTSLLVISWESTRVIMSVATVQQVFGYEHPMLCVRWHFLIMLFAYCFYFEGS
jgi:hypothetical protein